MNNNIEIVRINRVAYLIMNKPKANCYEIELMKQLMTHLESLESDQEVKIIVLKSALNKFFCAGADINVFASNSTGENQKMVESARATASRLEASKKITIAALNGHTLGGGLELALACDIRLASDTFFFLGLPEVKLGLMPGNGGTQRLLRLINPGKAIELLLTGDTVNPQEAYHLGLVNQIYPKDKFDRSVASYAEKLALGPALALAAIKTSVQKGIELPLCEALKLEAQLSDTLYDTHDAREGKRAFLEKRLPNFK